MRAREPDTDGFIERDGVKVGYEVFGGDAAGPTVLLLPTWSIIHSRHWKGQVPFLARHGRVITVDGRGCGRSDRPRGAKAYHPREFAADALAVMDATGTDRAVLVGLSLGAVWGLQLAADHAERVAGLVAIAPAVRLADEPLHVAHPFDEPYGGTEGWAKWNAQYWRDHYADFLAFFFGEMFTEPHSTKQIEDCVGWGLEVDPETLIATSIGGHLVGPEALRAMAERVHCPVLVIHSADDAICPYADGAALAEITGGALVTLRGAGHGPHARDPVTVNLVLRDFLASVCPSPLPSRSWGRGIARSRRALYVSSPIGLGHARRDLAVAQHLRRHRPDLQIDWLAQHPVTAMLEEHGEHVHPASTYLANESAHIASESGEHDLHCFQAWRRMDEILVANFMVFHDITASGDYDLVIGDEAWEVDYFLHENPELKRFAYAWLTDFVGWLPMANDGGREAALAADYNAEMIAQIARYPRIRDHALFVGNPGDIVADDFGPGLPAIAEWTRAHFDFPGYVTGYDPSAFSDRAALRARLGYGPDELVCVVTVGGSGVGGHLLRLVMSAYPEAKRAVPQLRMVVVAGPRIDPAALPRRQGVDVHGYVPGLHHHLAACDLAIVQGGLTTCMELTASGRPFLYFPLAHHFEQNFHVEHRLRRYRAGRRMDYANATPETIAAAITEEIGRDVSYRQVETDGASKAAALIAELL